MTDQQDLRATHEILALFENSKNRIELVIDEIPLAVATVDEAGTLLKANNKFCALFKSSPELTEQKNIQTLFSKENHAIFQNHLNLLLKAKEKTSTEFELNFNPASPEGHIYFWQITPANYKHNYPSRLFNLIGNEITEYKNAIGKVTELKKDIELAGAVQELLLPKQRTLTTRHFNLILSYQSASAAGGDWVWYNLRKEDGSILILMGDVTGHGAGSAMITAIMAGAFRAIEQLKLIQRKPIQIPIIFNTLNTILTSSSGGEYWMTFCAIEIFPKQKKLRYTTSGAPPIFVMRRNGEIERIAGKGSPLGSSPEDQADFEVKTVKFNPQDRLLAFTDGAYEIYPENEVHNLKTLKKLFQCTRNLSLEASSQLINERLNQVRQGAPPHDDTTLILVELLNSIKN